LSPWPQPGFELSELSPESVGGGDDCGGGCWLAVTGGEAVGGGCDVVGGGGWLGFGGGVGAGLGFGAGLDDGEGVAGRDGGATWVAGAGAATRGVVRVRGRAATGCVACPVAAGAEDAGS